MVIFNSYVSLPEGIHGPRFHRTKHRPNQFEREGHVESHWYRFLFLSQDESYWIGRPRGILIGRQHIHEKVAIRLSGSICSMGVRTASCESMWKHHKYLIVSLCFCKESNVKADLFNLFQIIFHNHWLTNICIYIIYIYIYIYSMIQRIQMILMIQTGQFFRVFPIWKAHTEVRGAGEPILSVEFQGSFVRLDDS